MFSINHFLGAYLYRRFYHRILSWCSLIAGIDPSGAFSKFFTSIEMGPGPGAYNVAPAPTRQELSTRSLRIFLHAGGSLEFVRLDPQQTANSSGKFLDRRSLV